MWFVSCRVHLVILLHTFFQKSVWQVLDDIVAKRRQQIEEANKAKVGGSCLLLPSTLFFPPYLWVFEAFDLLMF